MGLRDSDVLGRHGGEEFAILLPETPPARAVEVADRLRRMLAQTEVTRPDGTPVGFTASFGIAGVDVVGDEDLADLVRAADRAMYVAKEEGRNCVRCSPALQAGRI
jgi:diguanylate cyclase (GGDEF)-like protein